jgi:hypothetical protein
MNQILTDIMGLFKRKEIITDAKDADIIALGSKKVTSSTPVSGTTPPDKVSLITASDFVTNYVAPKVGPTTNNTVYGLDAFKNNTTGEFNVAIGYQSSLNNTTGSFNVAVGNDAMKNSYLSEGNTAIGDNAMLGVFGSEGTYNVAIGDYTLYSLSSGNQNVAIGSEAGGSITDANDNIAIGPYSMSNNLSGSGNIAIGTACVNASEMGQNSVHIGQENSQTATGSNNTSIGSFGNTSIYSNCITIGTRAEAQSDNDVAIGSSSYPVGTITAYTGASAETWEITINGVTKKIMLAP